MDLAVSDANVLIHLAKLDQLELLKELFSNILISDIIYSESVTQGKLSNKKDSLSILNQIQINLKEYRFHPKLVDKIIEEVNKKKFSTNLKR